MSIYRLYTQRDLQLDVNLLTSVFPVALADALDRVFAGAVEILPNPDEDRGLAAVRI